MTDATEQHDEWCAKNGCRCGKCPCGEFDDCPPMTDATELDEAMRARVSEYLATWEPYRGGQSLSTHGGKHLFLKDVRALLAALDEIERLRAALDEARAEVADAHHEGFGCGVAWAVGDDEEAPPALLARAEAAESALAAVRALADRAREWVDHADTSPHLEVFGTAWMHTTLIRELSALATPTTPEETQP